MRARRCRSPTDYRGGALNLAARLCSLAGPGEILASETVLQLARAMEGIRYGERRRRAREGHRQAGDGRRGAPGRPADAPLGPATAPADGAPDRLQRRSVRLGAGAHDRGRARRSVQCSSSPGRGSSATRIKQQSDRIRCRRRARSRASFRSSASGVLGLARPEDLVRQLRGQDPRAQVDTKTHRLVHPFIRHRGRHRRAWPLGGRRSGSSTQRSRRCCGSIPSTGRSTGSRCRRPKARSTSRRPPRRRRGRRIGVGRRGEQGLPRSHPRKPFASSRRSTSHRRISSSSATEALGRQQQHLVDQRDRPGDQPGREDRQIAPIRSTHWRWAADSSGRRSLPDNTLWKIDLNGNLEKTLDVGAGDVA